MSKPVLGIVLGIIFGALDGLTSVMYPEVMETEGMLMGILIGSTIKGLIVGIIVGFAARKVRSLAKMLIIGFGVSLFFAALVAWTNAMVGQPYWLEIMIPGAIVGLILGYSTQKYGNLPESDTPAAPTP